MKSSITSTKLALKLWLHSALILAAGIFSYFLIVDTELSLIVLIASLFLSITCSFPAFIILIILLPLVRRFFKTYKNRLSTLILLFLLIAIIYSVLAGMCYDNPFGKNTSFKFFLINISICMLIVSAAIAIAFFINKKYISLYFLSSTKNQCIMEENLNYSVTQNNVALTSNKLWIKGIITAVLILLMLIPTVFVSNLVEERQERQNEVKKEVSSKWAGEQTITFPYLYIPYTITTTSDGKIVTAKKSFIILPENLSVSGSVSTEKRQRSIYSVLLYNTSLVSKGNFNIRIPADVNASAINWNDANICFGLSDFKGIQQKISANINNGIHELTAGLPTNEIDKTGLSAPINLSADNVGKTLSFELPLKIKGSDQLHFLPLAGDSHFSLTSAWNSPSFDGNVLPVERSLNNNGFEANWNFNKANLPFSTLLENFNFKKDDYAFGVTLLQPTDQYAKTLRCVKYAILFIGLSFSLFFIVEIMQKKPFHPVQYVLVGLALIVFYTLLLSISEFLLFDIAYLIASVATVSLITLYAQSHFKSWKVAGAFAGTIGFIYGFIFVLIRLEDTALLVGSIGLFIILAITMYVSRKINWYGYSLANNVSV